METKHTKGKWTIDKYNTIVDENGDTIRVTGLCLAGRISEEVQANSKLIAAAPDLLEALSILIDFPKEDLEHYKKYGVTLSLNELQYNKIINAINKAIKWKQRNQ